MTRKLSCIRINELGRVKSAPSQLCRYAVKPLTERVCNDDKPCDRTYIIQNTNFVKFSAVGRKEWS